ncbi:Crp/Fnr family transcriptional regulator [Actinoplanes sp. TRM 88003]|uniref:Crp/Fnr family transcriptional regulator n=1 Tax=Paractinoplanes aksuensis TaxID=2939490 RepID=A0ABT1E0E2_9ACTN|nr:Crp/Fnr family transcriptional regulator [Actinoplanes aksuensis]MCO8276609.1 Crp/Fnr family transcriptional regulator [Actinoplanes aksuensis]
MSTLETWPRGSLLAGLTEPTVRALLRLGPEQTMPTGGILMREGSAESDVVVIRRGVAKVSTGKSLISIRAAGDLVGEMAALDGSPRCATITMAGPGRVVMIPAERFTAFLGRHPDAALAVATMVATRLRWSNRRQTDFTVYPIRVRVARILTELTEQHGHPLGHGALELGVRLTQPELATLCGAAEGSVHKALRELRDAHLVSTRYGRITVWDPQRLRAAARA